MTRRRYSGFTEEEKTILKRIHKVQAQMEIEMKNMSYEEKVAYLKDIPISKKHLRGSAR